MNTSDIWAVLGIEPTDDTGKIGEAYYHGLSANHPEDNPSGFMKLRSAYEEALALAAKKAKRASGEDGEGSSDELDSAAGAEDGADDDTAAIREMLSDFPRRMDEGEWDKLFEALEVNTIDKQTAFSEKLLIALMDGQYLPRRIWQLLDKTFSWAARAKQLKEVFPPGYIEYVLNGARYDRALRDSFFDYEKDKGEDFDAFVKAYHELAEVLREGDFDGAEKLVAANGQERLFAHPDYRLLVSRLRRAQERFDEERKILEGLDASWPGDPFIQNAIGDALISEKPGEALEIYQRILETKPEHYSARIGAARARADTGLLEEAKADAYELLMQDPFDGAAMGIFSKVNEDLVPVFRKRLDDDPGDMEARYKLSSCHFNLGNFEESLDLIADVEPDEEHRAKHYELYADLFVITSGDLSEEDKGILLEYIEAWEAAETDRQRLKFLPEKYHRLGMDDVALEKAKILLMDFPDDPELCRIRAQIFRERGDEHNAFAAIRTGLEKSPSHAILLSVEALLLEESGNLGAAADSANAALASFPYNIEMWELLGRVYERADKYDEVLDIIGQSEELGLSSNALSLLKAVAFFEKDEKSGEAQDLFEEALERNPDNVVCLEKLSMIYARAGRTPEAYELASRLVETHESPYAYLLRGWINAYFPQTADQFSKARARADFRKAIELDERYAPAWHRLGILAYDEGRMAEAAADFQLTIDIDPDYMDVYYYLALAYNQIGEPANSLRVMTEGIELAREKDDEQNYNRLLLKKADLLYEQHHYVLLAELGEEPSTLVEPRAEIAARRCDLAYALYETNEDEKAEAIFQSVFEAMESLPDAEKAQYMGSLNSDYAEFLRFAKQDPGASLVYYKKADEAVKSMRSAVWLAKAFGAAGEDKEAEKTFKRALKFRKDRTACADFLNGECYYGLKNNKKAKEYLERAVQGAAEYSGCPKRCCFEALFTLALIALEEGDRDRAKELYAQVLDTVEDRDYRSFAALFE